MKLPRLGTVCAVTWVDSGMWSMRTDSLPKNRRLPRYTTIGKLVGIDAERITMPIG